MKETRPRPSNSTVFQLTLVLGISFVFSGCAFGGPDHLDPKEPYPSAPAAGRPTHHYVAALVVYTEAYWDVNVGDPDAGTQWRYTGYTIYNDQGKKVAYIGQSDQVPPEISLEPGRYLVLLDRSAGHIRVFWVKIEQGRITEVRTEQLLRERSSS